MNGTLLGFFDVMTLFFQSVISRNEFGLLRNEVYILVLLSTVVVL